jgi:hypothetical protein
MIVYSGEQYEALCKLAQLAVVLGLNKTAQNLTGLIDQNSDEFGTCDQCKNYNCDCSCDHYDVRDGRYDDEAFFE